MTTRTFGGAMGWNVAALAAMGIGLWCGAAAAQTPAPGGQTPPPAGATPPAQQDPFTVENLIGDAVSLSNQAYPEVESAIQRFKNGDGIGAKEYLDQAKQKYPKLPPVDLLLAKLQILARNGEQARALLESTVTNYPADPEAYLLLAEFAMAEGRVTESHALFEKANGLVQKFAENPKRQQKFQIRVLNGLSMAHERRQQWNEALGLLTKWVELEPDSAVAHVRLGVTQFKLKKVAEAYEEFKKARALRPDSSHPDVMLGQLHTQENEIDKARKSFERAYAEDKKNEGTARAYAEWLIQQNELDKAQQVAAAMRKDQPNSVAALMLDGVVAKMRNQPEAAEEALTKVLTIDVANAGATNLLALILSESTNPAQQEKALQYANMNAQRFPTNTQTNITLAWILSKLGRTAESDAILQKVQAQQMNADSAYLVARIFVQKGQKDAARSALEQVLKQAGAGMFLYRKESEALLRELGGTVPQAGATTPAGAAAPAAGGTADPTGGAASAPAPGAPATPPVAGQ